MHIHIIEEKFHRHIIWFLFFGKLIVICNLSPASSHYDNWRQDIRLERVHVWDRRYVAGGTLLDWCHLQRRMSGKGATPSRVHKSLEWLFGKTKGHWILSLLPDSCSFLSLHWSFILTLARKCSSLSPHGASHACCPLAYECPFLWNPLLVGCLWLSHSFSKFLWHGHVLPLHNFTIFAGMWMHVFGSFMLYTFYFGVMLLIVLWFIFGTQIQKIFLHFGIPKVKIIFPR